MILSGYWTSRGDIFDIGLQSLRWLVESQTVEGGHFAPIGSNGFWSRRGERARFDQQPLEAHAMISACVETFSLTRDAIWHRAARRCQALGVGLLSGGYGLDELERAGAYRVYEDPADLLDHLDEVGGRR